MPRRWATTGSLILVGWVMACGDRPPEQAEPPPLPVVGEAPAPDPVETRVFMREPVPQVGPGRLVLHFLIPGDASREQIRQALIRTMEEATAADTALVAVRAIAYMVATPEPGRPEADLVPMGWGEWLPLNGWRAEATREQVHRFHTYQGAAPEW